jgi:hypothetical protein
VSFCNSGLCKGLYAGEQIFICSESQTALHALEASRITSKLALECQQAICALSNLNKIMLLWVLGYSWIQGNGNADAWLGRVQAVHFFIPNQHFICHHMLEGSKLMSSWQKSTQNTGVPHWVWDSRNSSLMDLPKTIYGPTGIVQATMKTSNRTVKWPLYTETVGTR